MVIARGVGAESRRESLLETLKRDGSIRLELAAAQLGVSAMTVRRDLDEMDAEGILRRVRGGAIASLDARPFSDRRTTRLAAKSAIVAKAALLLPSAGAIAIDASTTAGGLAGYLYSTEALTVVTNSYENFLALAQNRSIAPILTGGEIDLRTGSFVGAIACQAASSILYSRFFTSANAVDSSVGSSEVSLSELQVKRAFAGRSKEIVLLVDSSKLDQQSISVGFALVDVAVMVTELDPAHPLLDAYRSQVELL